MIEIRLDKLRSQNGLGRVANALSTPLIATNRSTENNGSLDRSETDRMTTLSNAVENGFTYVDIDVGTLDLDERLDSLRGKGAKIVLSHHDYNQTPKLSTLKSIRARLERHGPNISKIVTTARTSLDNLIILQLLDKKESNGSAIVGFAMGEAGVWSRIMSPFYGAAFTYASLDKGLETAPGQPTISDLRTIYQAMGLR